MESRASCVIHARQIIARRILRRNQQPVHIGELWEIHGRLSHWREAGSPHIPKGGFITFSMT